MLEIDRDRPMCTDLARQSSFIVMSDRKDRGVRGVKIERVIDVIRSFAPPCEGERILFQLLAQ